MSASVVGNLGGRRTWSGERNDEAHRTYNITHLVQCTSSDDGPAIILNASGLPAIGAYWNYGNDVDVWAFCWPTRSVKIHQEKEGDPAFMWAVTSTFSTKPISSKRCQDTPIEDPLLEPQKIGGSFTKTTEEAIYDRFGNLLVSSSWERFKGPLVEFDVSRPTVNISQNKISLELPLFTSMIDTVNDSTLWGLPARTIKLSNVEWSREIYGSCSYYYKRTFMFDIKYDTFDRDILDSGTKCLNGHWDTITGHWQLDLIGGYTPQASNPQHFSRYKDRKGENANVILDGTGLPADSITSGTGTAIVGGTGTQASGPAYSYHVEKYSEANFLLLGIPTTL